MVFHDLGALGTADVVPKKILFVKMNCGWEEFASKFAPELATVSQGSLNLLYEAIKSRKDVKIKKEGEELDAFFARIEANIKEKLPGLPQHLCKKCGKSLESGWKCCPFCCMPISSLSGNEGRG